MLVAPGGEVTPSGRLGGAYLEPLHLSVAIIDVGHSSLYDRSR